MGCIASTPTRTSSRKRSYPGGAKIPPWEEENTSVDIDELNRDLQRRKDEEEEYERLLYEEKERLRLLSVSLIGKRIIVLLIRYTV